MTSNSQEVNTNLSTTSIQQSNVCEIICHAYDWQVKTHCNFDDNGRDVILAWCLNRGSEPVLLRFHDFPAYCHLELPLYVGHKRMAWTNYKVNQVYESLCYRLGEDAPFKFFYKQAEKLYFYRGQRRYPMMVLLFKNASSMNKLVGKTKYPLKVRDLGLVACKVWEHKISAIRKLLTLRDVKYSQWFKIQGVKVVGEDKVTQLEHEYVVDRKTMFPIAMEECQSWVTNPAVLSFDIETYSDKHNAMPDPYCSKHVAYMISGVYQRLNFPDTKEKFIILLGDCYDIEGVKIYRVESEKELINTFCQLILDYNPEVLTGYNIFGYDWPYLDTRLKRRMGEWMQVGRIINESCDIKSFNWGSSAYGHNDINMLMMDGRINIDLLPIIRRDYKLNKYKLDYVANFLLGRGKLDVSAREMFETYEMQIKAGETGSQEDKDKALAAMTRVVEYCVIDADLVIDIMDKIHCWIALIQTSNVMGVTPVDLFTRGQQLRVLSQVYDEASKKGIVVDSKQFPKMNYSGGFVFDPVPGLYDYVPCLDFKSLYPTVMISHNIDHRTFVPPELMDQIPDEDCHVIEWDEEVEDEGEADNDDADNDSSEKEAKVQHFKFKFVKKEILEGLIPGLLVRLIDERDAVRAEQKKHKKNSIEWVVLERRQLAVKVSCNSFYGILGAQKGGKLPLPDAAACVTAKSRESIKKVNEYLESKGHKIVYGDSVTGDTPVLLRYTYPNGEQKIGFRPISQIHEQTQIWITYDDSGKQYLIKPTNLEVWSDKGFTAIKHVMRHKTKKRIYRITTHTGVIKVTEDHSLLNSEGCEISPNDVDVGDHLLTKSLPTLSDDGIDIDHAFAMGLFYGDGSCGDYMCNSGRKRSWAINNQNRDYLNEAKRELELAYPDHKFKILDTMKSSGVYKLVPVGDVKSLVEEWRELFYDHPSRYKKVPDILWQCSLETREEFYRGYYAADGDKDSNGYNRFCNKGQIGAAGLFFLSRSIGYKVSCNTRSDKMDIYRMTLTKRSQRKAPGIIKKIEDLGYIDDYVYDLETENHHFAAGVGELVVHNTDSSMPDIGIRDGKTAYAQAKAVAEELTKLFPPPMVVEDEEVYYRMLCIKKKMYLCIRMTPEGEPIMEMDKVKFKGVTPARRDNCKYKIDSYMNIAWKVLTKRPMMETYNEIIDMCLRLLRHEVSLQDLVCLKGLGGHYKSKTFCMKIFSDELSRIGKPATPGERLEYLIVNSKGITGKQNLGYKMRTPETFYERCDTDEVEHIDYLYYIENLLMNAIEKQLFQVAYGKQLAELEEQYKIRDREKVIEALHKEGYSVQVYALMNKFNNDMGKVIQYLIDETKLKTRVKKLVSYHIRKYRRIDTRVHKNPIKMMGKLIRQKQKCMDQIKTIVHVSEVPKYKKVKLNVISYEEYQAKRGNNNSDNSNNEDGNNNSNEDNNDNNYNYVPRPNNTITNWIHNKTAEMKYITRNNQ